MEEDPSIQQKQDMQEQSHDLPDEDEDEEEDEEEEKGGRGATRSWTTSPSVSSCRLRTCSAVRRPRFAEKDQSSSIYTTAGRGLVTSSPCTFHTYGAAPPPPPSLSLSSSFLHVLFSNHMWSSNAGESSCADVTVRRKSYQATHTHTLAATHTISISESFSVIICFLGDFFRLNRLLGLIIN